MDKPSGNIGRARGRAGAGNQAASTGGRGRRPAQMVSLSIKINNSYCYTLLSKSS